MLNKPINNILKEKFQLILAKANNLVNEDYYKDVTAKIHNLDNYSKLVTLDREMKAAKRSIENDPHPYYIKNHNSENWLLTQFSSRSFLLNIDESKELFNSLYLGKYKHKLSKDIRDILKQIPKYTLKQFLRGHECKYFSNFENYYNIEEEDYYKIVKWQSDNLVNIISYESNILIKQIQEHCKTLNPPIEFIHTQLSIIEDELIESVSDAKALKKILSKLFIFEKFSLTNFDDDILMENYKIFLGERVEWKKICPKTINNVINNFNKKPDRLFSNEYMIFYTIDQLTFWFKSIVEGASIQKDITTPNWASDLEKTIKDAESEVEAITVEIDNYAYNPNHEDRDIKEYLMIKLEEYRFKFNDFETKEIFHIIREESKETLLSMFKTNSFFGNDIVNQIKAIKEAFIIQNVSWNIVMTYKDIFDSINMSFSNTSDSHTSIMFLMHQMVLDKEIYNELSKSLDDTLFHFMKFSMPFDINVQNHIEKFRNLFYKCIRRLQDILDDAEPTKKVLYIQSRIKELKQREYHLASDEEYFNKNELKYSNLFKDFLSIEADFIKETSLINKISFLSPNSQTFLLEYNQESKNEKETNWFRVGLLFANGEMDILLEDFNRNGSKIAEHLGNKTGFRPYITESIGISKSTSKKSIFSDRTKMKKIISHCMECNIEVVKSFTDNLPIE